MTRGYTFFRKSNLRLWRMLVGSPTYRTGCGPEVGLFATFPRLSNNS